MSNYILIKCDPHFQFCGTTFLAGDLFHGAKLVVAYVKEAKEKIDSLNFTLQDPEDYSVHHFRVKPEPSLVKPPSPHFLIEPTIDIY